MMTERRFNSLISAHGADPARWPAAERDAGRAWAARHPTARRALEAEARLDALLDRAAPPPMTEAASAALADRIMATLDARDSGMAAMPPPAVIARGRRPTGLIATVCAMAAVALVGLGLLLGRSVSLSQTTTAEADQLLLLGGPALTAGFSS
jgi:hypothetical protein